MERDKIRIHIIDKSGDEAIVCPATQAVFECLRLVALAQVHDGRGHMIINGDEEAGDGQTEAATEEEAIEFLKQWYELD